MHRLALALALSVSAASGAAITSKLDTEIYVQPVVADVEFVGVNANGACPAPTDAGVVPSIVGGKPGTCFRTVASVSVRSSRPSIPALQVPHDSTSNPLAETSLRALITTVALPRLAALEPVRSNPDLWDAPTLADVEPIIVHRPAGKDPRLAICGTARSKRAGVPDFRLCDSNEPPRDALAALVLLLDSFVLPAVRAEVFP